MTIRQRIFLTVLILSILLVSAWGVQAEGKPVRYNAVPSFTVAEPRIGIASFTQANADNLMMFGGATIDDPLAEVERAVRFRLCSNYEAIFFRTGAGSAKFELEVYLLRSRELLGSDQTMIAGTGPKQSAGSLGVNITLNEPGIYRLAIVSRSTAQALGAPGPVIDEDEIIVYVIVGGGATDSTNGSSGLALIRASAGEATASPLPVLASPPVPVPTDRELQVASPRGHFLYTAVAAAENFDRNHGRVLVVREGDSVTFKSAYEFVWFHGAAGTAQTELVIRIESAKDGEDPLGEDQTDISRDQGPWKLAGVLSAEVPFNDPGYYTVLATIRTRVDPPASTPGIATEDEDTVRVYVWVLGEPHVGAISGIVTEDENDVPLERVAIRVYKADTKRFVKIVYTGPDGSYKATGLEPGEYLVQADPLGQNYLPEWYDDAPTREEADPVTVVADETTEGIDFGLTPGGVISGQVIEDDPDATTPVIVPIPGVSVLVGRFDDNVVVAQTHTRDDGTYRLEKLPADTYWVWAGSATKSLIGEYYDDHLQREDADPIDVGAGQEVSDIDFALRYGGSVAGRVTCANEPSGLAPCKVTAYDWDSNEAIATVDTDRSGFYLVPSLPEGAYRIYAWDEAGRYVPEYYDDATDPEDATPVIAVVSHVFPNETFSITVEIKEVTDLGAFSLILSFDPLIVEGLDVELGGFLGSTGRSVVEGAAVIDNVGGTVTYGAVSYGDQAGPDGAGVLATITFRALASGESALQWNDTELLDTQAAAIVHRTRDGRVVASECIFGDFDCDCDVDIVDIMQVAIRWGSQVGDPEYDPLYDLDGDGDIDIVDVALVAAAWGNTCDDPGTTSQGGGARVLSATLLSTGLRTEPASAAALVGDPVTLQVWIDEALDLGSFEFTLTYDATRLSLAPDDVVLGDFLGSTGRSTTAMGPQIVVDGGVGTLNFGGMTLGATPPGPDGSGVLAEITFTAVAGGEADVSLVSAQVTDTTGASLQQMALQGATVNISASPRSFVPFVKR